MSKPMTRKRCTVDVRERRQVTYRIGQRVFSKQGSVGSGVIEAMIRDGAFLKQVYHPYNRVFATWSSIRPDSGRYWL